MNRPNAFTSNLSKRGLSALLFTIGASAGYAQTVTIAAGQGSSPVTLGSHPAMVAAIVSDADTAQDAIRSSAISSAEGKVISVLAMKALPIPVVGAIPVEGAMHMLSRFKKHTTKGYQVTYLQGLSAETEVTAGVVSFTVSALPSQDVLPALLRVRSSAKDSARIVRSVHVAYKMTGSQINPATVGVLGIHQDEIQCTLQANAGGSVFLATSEPLTTGEYAVVLLPKQPSLDGSASSTVWDFRVR